MLGKYAGLKQAFAKLGGARRNPFSVVFDEIVSPTEARLGGRDVLLFGTNNYLGMTFDPACVAAAEGALRREGTGTTGSRIANGTYAGHTGLERQLAAFLGKREAMVFTTGYQANLGTLSGLCGREDHLLLDADSHASIYDGAKLSGAKVTRFRHNDPDDLARRLRLLASEPGDKLVVAEGIYSMLGDVAPLREFAQVKREAGAFLLVDEAHSLGVLGEHGRGLAELCGVEADADFIVGTFSKSLGGVGGFCASDLEDFSLLRLASRSYMFSASMPSSITASVSEALRQMQARPELRARLSDNAARLHAGLDAAGFALGPVASPIVAVRLGDPETAAAMWDRLLGMGLYVNLALPPATPGGQSLLRTSVSAAHSTAQVDRAVAVIVAASEEMGLVGARRHLPAAQ